MLGRTLKIFGNMQASANSEVAVEVVRKVIEEHNALGTGCQPKQDNNSNSRDVRIETHILCSGAEAIVVGNTLRIQDIQLSILITASAVPSTASQPQG